MPETISEDIAEMNSKSMDRKHRTPLLDTERHRDRYRVKRTISKSSMTPSEDESDSDEDEEERRKYINLNIGQTFACFMPRSNHFHLAETSNHPSNKGIEKRLAETFDEAAFREASLRRANHNRRSQRHVRNASSPPELFDQIQMNNDFEYGFNPNRPTGSYLGNQVKLRPLSLHSPEPVRERSNTTIPDQQFPIVPLPSTNDYILPSKSHAKTDLEAKYEREIFFLRSQPSSLDFHGREGKINEQEFQEDRANAKRRRFVRRQLSFDSRSKRRWKKTMSLDSGLATEVYTVSKRSLAATEVDSRSEEVLDLEEKDRKSLDRIYKSDEMLLTGDIMEELIVPMDVQAQNAVNNSVVESDTSSFSPVVGLETLKEGMNDTTDSLPIKLLTPPKIDVEPPEVDNLLGSGKDERESGKGKRRGSIPHILSAFRLPGKKNFRKLMKKKVPESPAPLKANHVIITDVVKLNDTISEQSDTSVSPTPIIVTEPSDVEESDSISTKSSNTFQRKGDAEASNRSTDKSCSAYSLSRVDEG